MCTARSNEQAGRSGRIDLPSGDLVLLGKHFSADSFEVGSGQVVGRLRIGSEGWKRSQLQTQVLASGFDGLRGPPS